MLQAWFLVFLLLPGEVHAWLEKGTCRVGEAVLLGVELKGEEAADCFLEPLPEVPGVLFSKVSGPKMELGPDGYLTRFELSVVPLKAGPVSIPALAVSAQGGKRFLCAPLSLTVLDDSPPSQASLKIEGPAICYLHQPLVFEVVLLLKESLFDKIQTRALEEWIHIPLLESTELFLPLKSPPQKEASSRSIPLRDGKGGLVFVHEKTGEDACALKARIALMPIETGIHDLGIAYYSVRFEEGDPLFLKSPDPRIEVLPLPIENRPDSATNGVGRFTVSIDATPLEVTMGQSLALRLTVEGEGNVEFLQMPRFQTLEKRFHLQGVEDGHEGRRRWRIFHIAPRDRFVNQIPALAFSWFDYKKEGYVTFDWGPQAITVLPGRASAMGTASEQEEIDSILLEEPNRDWTALFGPIALAALFLSTLALLWAARSRVRKKAEDILRKQARSREAYERFREAFARDPKSGADVFIRYVAERFGLPLPEVQAGAPGRLLMERGVSRALAERVDRFCVLAEKTRFDPAREGFSSVDLVEEMARLLEEEAPS